MVTPKPTITFTLMGYETNGALERTRAFTVKPPGGEAYKDGVVISLKSWDRNGNPE